MKISWRVSFTILFINGLVLTLLALAAVLRLWYDRGGLQQEFTVFNMVIGGGWGTLNFCGAYVICRTKRAFVAGNIDTVWCERACILIPIPLVLLAIGIYILVKFYP